MLIQTKLFAHESSSSLVYSEVAIGFRKPKLTKSEKYIASHKDMKSVSSLRLFAESSTRKKGWNSIRRRVNMMSNLQKILTLLELLSYLCE